MKTCAEYEELISALLDGELSAQECEEVKAHIAVCPQCRAMYDAFAAVSAVEAPELPENLHADIMNKVGMAAKAMKTQAKIVRLRRTFASAACLVVLVGTLFSIGRARPEKAANDAAGAPAAAEAPKMSVPYATESESADDATDYGYTADMAAPAEPAAPAAPMAPEEPAAPAEPAMPAPMDNWNDESAHSELAGIFAEVVSVDEGTLQVRSDVGEMFTVLVTDETELAGDLAASLAPGCIIEVAFDPARSDDAQTLFAVRILLHE